MRKVHILCEDAVVDSISLYPTAIDCAFQLAPYFLLFIYILLPSLSYCENSLAAVVISIIYTHDDTTSKLTIMSPTRYRKIKMHLDDVRKSSRYQKIQKNNPHALAIYSLSNYEYN